MMETFFVIERPEPSPAFRVDKLTFAAEERAFVLSRPIELDRGRVTWIRDVDDIPGRATLEAIAGVIFTAERRVNGTAIVLVPEDELFFHELTVEENLTVPLVSRGCGASERRALAREALNEVGLNFDRRAESATSLSGGERRLLAIARGIALLAAFGANTASGPRVLLLDHPFSGLHPRARDVVWDTVQRLTSNKIACAILEDDASPATAGCIDLNLSLHLSVEQRAKPPASAST